MNLNFSRSFSAVCALVAAPVLASLLVGCGFGPSAQPETVSGQLVTGRAMGGEAPITSASVTLYASAVNSSISGGTYIGTAQSLQTVTSNATTGTFSFSGYTCPSNTILYVVAYGGSSGAGTNTNILLAAPIGQCGSLNASTDVDEITTVATAYAFSGFLSINTSGASPVVNITAPANNSSFATTNSLSTGTSGSVTTASGLLHAYENAVNLANMTSGTANTAPVTNSSASVPAALINTIANALEACTNAVSPITTNCNALFAATPSASGVAPTNTLQAALNLARNPYPGSTASAALFTLGSAQSAFQPTLSSAPADWTVAISYPVPPNPVSGIGFPWTAALDADDNVFVTSPENDIYIPTSSAKLTQTSISACLFGWTSDGLLRPTITAYSGTIGSPGTAGTGTPGTSTWFCSGKQAATTQTDYLLTQIAADAYGSIWMANDGNTGTTPTNLIVETSNSGAFVNQYATPTLSSASAAFTPIGLGVDKFNNVWFNVLSSTGGAANIGAFESGTTATNGTASSTGTSLAITAGGAASGATFAAAGRSFAFDSNQNFIGASYGGSSGSAGSLSLGGTIFYMPISTNNTPGTYTAVFKKALGGASTSSGTTNNGPFGTAVDSSNNDWMTTAGAPGQTSSFPLGLFKSVPSGGPPYTTATPTQVTGTTFTSPKFLEVDGGSVVWVADSTGIMAYASALGTPAYLNESGGFTPCVPSGTSCTYPDFSSTKGIAIDSTGSLWFTTPDLTTSTANSNRLFQIIGSAAPTWPLLATGKPGVMPQ